MDEPLGDIPASIRRSAAVVASLEEQSDKLQTICDVVIEALVRGNKVLTAGHGGSAADALHMAEEFVGRFNADRRPLPAISLVADPTLITCIVNDYGFSQLFPRQVEALGQKGDILVLFTTSGNGEGLRKAAEVAFKKGVTTLALLGKGGGGLKGKCDHEIIIASDETARIQEAHTLILHIILEAVDRRFAARH